MRFKAFNTAAAALSMVVYCKIFGYLMDRLSARTVGGICMVAGPVFTVLVWLFVAGGNWSFNLPLAGVVSAHKGMTLIILGSLVNAGLFGFVGLAHVNMLADIVPQRGRTVAMALQFAFISLLGAGGAYTGGRLMDMMKAAAPDGFGFLLPGGEVFTHIHVLALAQVLIIWCGALPLLLSVRMPNETIKFREAFDRVLLANPFRFVFGIHNARILAQPASRKNRFKAVEAMGDNATVIALADIVARTRDPNIDIREAATRSLGKIGNDEAIHALVEAAARPDSDIAVPALRALRACAVPDIAPSVIPLLSHLNIEVVREAARTLGAARNPAAIEPLSNLLHATRQAAVAVAAAEALSHLGDSSAVYAIIPRMRNPAISDCHHRAYATAVADLLGERDFYYKVLTLDESAHGSGLALLVKRLRSDIAHTGALDFDPSLREHIFTLVSETDRAYEARDLPACARALFVAACAFATLRYNTHYQDDVPGLLAALEARDPLFAAGAWYTAVLDGAFQRANAPDSLAPIRTETEALLGAYILASWSRTTRDPGLLRALRHPNPAPPANEPRPDKTA
ncbi:MAG: HEAT repeat domain-containing protein [Kiritimatiellaeota bacterium]|nr:HEAT repeat domain-containing protein [Kiritimatiellota bacterium]